MVEGNISFDDKKESESAITNLIKYLEKHPEAQKDSLKIYNNG